MVSSRGRLGALWALLTAVSLHAEQVVISRIMYHPRAGKPAYVELFNNTSNPFDIAKWRLTGGARFEFPDFSTTEPSASFLKPFERLVLSGADPAATRLAYGIPASVRVFGPWKGALDSPEERVTLKDKNAVTVCRVSFGRRGPWPAAADGTGHALTLIDPNRKVDDWRNWTVSTRPDAAPGSAPAPNVTSPSPSPEIEGNLGLVLVDYGSVWHYNDAGRNLGTPWREPAFEDSAWPQGPGLLGWDRKPLPKPGLNTRVTFGRQITYYFRHKFVYPGGAKPGDRLVIDQIIDDGVIYYLNGKELGRTRMPAGPVNYMTLTTSTVPDAAEEVSEFTLEPGLLLEGTNVLAAEVHQCKPTSSDIVFGMRLRVTPAPKPGLVINELFADPRDGFIEFCNAAREPAALKGCFLSDNADDLRQHSLSTDLVVPPDGLAAVSLAECGLSNSGPLTVYLTAPDGQTVLNAVTVNFAEDGRSLGRRPDGGGQWFRLPEPTRGRPNPTRETTMPLRLNEVHFKNGVVDWVELVNTLDVPFAPTDLFLASTPELSDKVALSPPDKPAAAIPAKGCRSWEVKFPVQDGEARLYLANSAGAVLQCEVFSFPKADGDLQAYPDGGKEWYASTNSTRDLPNAPPRRPEVVINEIMYDPPYHAEGTEFIELFNRGNSVVDLAGWRFVEGISFIFPPGTAIPAGGFLVVAAKAERLKSVYGEIPVVGDYKGRLRHGGERLRLVDAQGNLVNEVDFRAGGDWPALAHGGGSSMELLHPWMDNGRGSAWRDSEESGKSAWQICACTNVYLEMNPLGSPTDYREVHLYLVGHGHVALRNVGLWKNGVNYLDQPTQMSTDGSSATGWLAQGTHCASHLTNGELHLVADGRGDNRADRVEIDCVRIQPGQRYELRFEARWISGCPRLVAQTWDHSIGASFLLALPARLGTPGRPNSVSPKPPFEATQAAPQVDGLLHSPAVPQSTNTVRITAKVACAAPLASVRLFHRPDNAEADAPWASKPMFDDGAQGGDAAAGDGIYTAELTEYRTNEQVVQFYVQAVAANGQSLALPRRGAEWPAMYVVDDRKIRRDLRVDRFVVSAYDLGSMANGNSPKYGFRHPKLSNHHYNMTFISNEKEIFYGGGIRVSGSPFTRGTDLGKSKWELPEDRPFRGRTHFYFDNDSNHHNRVCRYLLYQLGHVTSEAEWTRVILNSSSPYLKEDTEPLTSEFVQRNFKDGNHGELYRIDDEWWFTDEWDHENRDADWQYKGTDDSIRYRTEWQKRTREVEDDYSALIAFFKTYSGNRYSQEEIERLLDVDAVLQLAAVRGYINDWDNFTMFRGKNGYFYRHADDGRFQFLQWDSDLAFRDLNYPLYGPRIASWLQRPYNLKRFNDYVSKLMELGESPRLATWLALERAAHPARSPEIAFYLSFFQKRKPLAAAMIAPNRTVPTLFQNIILPARPVPE
jgi:hypothetical protein